jgi:TolB protein
MPYPPRFVLTISLALTLLLAGLVVLARTALAAHAGEIAFESSRVGNWEIYLLDIQTGVTFNLTRNPADDIAPAWSPDGNQLAFVSDRDADNQPEIYIMDDDGNHVRRLRMDGGIYADPAWTADGRALVLTHGWKQIYRVEIEGNAEQWLGIGFAPRLSSDGQRLLYYNDMPGSLDSNLYLVNRADNRVTALTTGPTRDWDANWSPDGRQLMFVSSRSGRPNIYVMNTDGTNVRAVTHDGYDLSPAWSPDGRRIVYSSGVKGEMRLFVVDADGGNPHRLTNIDGDSHAPVWRPESR